MDVPVRLSDLGAMHPRLLWDEIAAATAAVLGLSPRGSPSLLIVELRDVPGFGSERLTLAIDAAGIVGSHIARVRRTYEPPRLVELAAVAVAAMALYMVVATRSWTWPFAALRQIIWSMPPAILWRSAAGPNEATSKPLGGRSGNAS